MGYSSYKLKLNRLFNLSIEPLSESNRSYKRDSNSPYSSLAPALEAYATHDPSSLYKSFIITQSSVYNHLQQKSKRAEIQTFGQKSLNETELFVNLSTRFTPDKQSVKFDDVSIKIIYNLTNHTPSRQVQSGSDSTYCELLPVQVNGCILSLNAQIFHRNFGEAMLRLKLPDGLLERISPI